MKRKRGRKRKKDQEGASNSVSSSPDALRRYGASHRIDLESISMTGRVTSQTSADFSLTRSWNVLWRAVDPVTTDSV